ncbi:MAG: hypothetical protein O3A25_20025 [Acidobacteria bacterium]|nr:hypothetical protein [Acidobacteriota bacterium]
MVLVTGQDSGVKALRPRRRDGVWSVSVVWETDEVAMELSNPVLVGDAVFGLSHRSAGQYFVLDARTGVVRWRGAPREADNTAVVKADDLLLLLNDDGEMIVGRLSGAGLERIRSYTVADSPPGLSPPFRETASSSRMSTPSRCGRLTEHGDSAPAPVE